MNKLKLDFTLSTNDQDYVVWVWKGNYLNLGAGSGGGNSMDILVKKVYAIISIVILSSLILTGCTPMINDRKEAEKIVATVIEYINNKDSEGLIALFCEEVNEKYELDSSIDTLFNMFDNEITSYEVSAIMSGQKSDFGVGSYSIRAIVEAYVDDKEYRIEVSKTIYDDQSPQRVGVTTVMAKRENAKKMFFVGEVNVFTSDEELHAALESLQASD